MEEDLSETRFYALMTGDRFTTPCSPRPMIKIQVERALGREFNVMCLDDMTVYFYEPNTRVIRID